MLRRLRQAARRWPGPCLALVTLAFSSQSLATTLDWCLHGGDGAHVASALVPCDDEHDVAAQVALDAPDAGTVAATLPVASPPCHGADAGPHPMHHVAASSDGASSPVPVVAALPVVAHWTFQPWLLAPLPSGADDPPRSRGASWPDARRPRLSGAVPGESSRLLI